MNTLKMTKIHTNKLSGINLEDFVTDQVFYESKDGTKVPMFIVRKKSVLPSIDETPSEPILTTLYGYGGFSVPITPFFSPKRLAYLNNMEGMLCVANIRGGGEYGEEWHQGGTREKK